ncbi:MAG TPA: DUF4149 domain-containing protein [Bacteriovoracaceae bacterium]|nr:DUF4149 domain-containing protein [Bacteriovoracaceae bacterium]
MKNLRLLHSLFLILTSTWLGWTILTDFFVVPTVFRTIDQYFLAGELGIAVFTRLNGLELMVSSALVVITLLLVRSDKKSWPLLGLSLLGWGLIVFYFSFLTPRITELTQQWEAVELGKLRSVIDLQQEHQYYHQLYIVLDTTKLLILSCMIGIALYRDRKSA